MLGTDICSIARLEAAQRDYGNRFEARLLTPAERQAMPTPTPSQLARRWALKEATAKALGTGIGASISFQDIEVTHTPAGAPVITVTSRPGPRFHASVSDDAGMAFAVVMLSP